MVAAEAAVWNCDGGGSARVEEGRNVVTSGGVDAAGRVGGVKG